MARRPRIELSGARVQVMPRVIAVVPIFKMARIENAFCILSTLSLKEQELDKMAKGASNSMGFSMEDRSIWETGGNDGNEDE